jgi:hypothetical protein
VSARPCPYADDVCPTRLYSDGLTVNGVYVTPASARCNHPAGRCDRPDWPPVRDQEEVGCEHC